MINNSIIVCAIVGILAYFYFTRFQESEKAYYMLYRRCIELKTENAKLKERIVDLQEYKNDVSKTFKILDNELIMINEHIKKQKPDNRVSILSPDVLNTLFQNINQESTDGDTVGEIPSNIPDLSNDNNTTNNVSVTSEPDMHHIHVGELGGMELNDNSYNRFLMNAQSI